ncbi:hypothetical protein DFH08DRAFT_888054 [Mycena albidolilacea]|uniref:Uncharacterized protein n=1 Tax=Mycena albidolilacea TaxID=1033008 RepID=A0AAD6ZI67_9AGAR|nr:hypothetical protein DFH08DRAFT_888054 [Mycena albidolilacea]
MNVHAEWLASSRDMNFSACTIMFALPALVFANALYIPQCLCSLDSARDSCRSYRIAGKSCYASAQCMVKIVIQYTQQCP